MFGDRNGSFHFHRHDGAGLERESFARRDAACRRPRRQSAITCDSGGTLTLSMPSSIAAVSTENVLEACAELLTKNVLSLIVVGPVSVFDPLKITVPAPFFAIEPVLCWSHSNPQSMMLPDKLTILFSTAVTSNPRDSLILPLNLERLFVLLPTVVAPSPFQFQVLMSLPTSWGPQPGSRHHESPCHPSQ